MKKYLIISTLLIFSGEFISAQQAPQYSHYLFNQFQINPAVAGTKDCLDMRFGYRAQWTGFENAPRTGFASLNGRIGKHNRNGTRQAIGIIFESDDAGIISKSLIQLAYAYHFKSGRNMNMSIGLFAGFSQYRIDMTEVIGDTTDPLISAGSRSNLLFPEVTPGFWMHNDRFFMGISAKHLTGNASDEEGTAKLLQHISLTGGYAYKMRGKVNFIPSTRVKFVKAAPLDIDINAVFDFDKRLALGVGYRNGDAVVGLFKFNFLNYFTVGYAYDMTTSPIRNASSNTHEVILGITACPGKTAKGFVPCSAYD